MKTIDKNPNMMAQRTGPERSHGIWPIINIEVVESEDFALVDSNGDGRTAAPPDTTEAQQPIGGLRRFLRVHVDVPLGDSNTHTTVREKLAAGSRKEAFDVLSAKGRLSNGSDRAVDFVRIALSPDY